MVAVGQRRQEPESFANLVRKASMTPGREQAEAVFWPQPIRDGHWTDDDGTRWHLRGRRAGPPKPVLRRLLKHPDLRILHAYGPRPTEVVGAERTALLDQVERYLGGDAPPYSEFRLAEFRDADRNVMLIIEEGC